MVQARPAFPQRSPTRGITPVNVAVIFSIVSGSCACASHESLGLYAGALQPVSETATVYAPPGVACPRIQPVDGMPVGFRKQAVLLPGLHSFDVSCKENQPRDPLGGWIGHQVIRLSLDPETSASLIKQDEEQYQAWLNKT
jgi:hypothetical protein